MKMSSKKLKHGFTLIEMLASMAVFLILITVMMRFFVSAQSVWIKSSRRNELYSNARIALDLISRDLQCALYNNDNSARGIYPFWFKKVNADVNELNFIAATDLKPSGAISNICELRYTYISSSGPNLTPTSGSGPIDEGWLVRSCTGDDDTTDYNFMSNTQSVGSGRLDNIWTSTDKYAQVIPGVIKLEFVCFDKNDNSFAPLASSDQYGTYFPVVVTIRLKLMDQENWRKYLKLKNTGSSSTDEEAEALKNKVARTFSRTVYLGKRESI